MPRQRVPSARRSSNRGRQSESNRSTVPEGTSSDEEERLTTSFSRRVALEPDPGTSRSAQSASRDSGARPAAARRGSNLPGETDSSSHKVYSRSGEGSSAANNSSGNARSAPTRDPQSSARSRSHVGRSSTAGRRPSGTGGDRRTGPPTGNATSDGRGYERSQGASDVLSAYGPSQNPEQDYCLGRVIECLHVPQSTDTSVTPNAQLEPGSNVHKRRYVVISPARSNETMFSALPIKTYNGEGVAYPGVVKWHHCIIYTQRRPPHPNPPPPTSHEQPQRRSDGLESPMQQMPILVSQDDLGTALDPLSRLNLFEVTSLEKRRDDVKLFGMVHENYMHALVSQHQAVRALASSFAARRQPNPAIEALRTWYNEYRTRFSQAGLTPPAQLSEEQLRLYANNETLKLQLAERLSAAWYAGQQQSQQQGRRTASSYEEEEDEDEDEDGSNDDNDDEGEEGDSSDENENASDRRR